MRRSIFAAFVTRVSCPKSGRTIAVIETVVCDKRDLRAHAICFAILMLMDRLRDLAEAVGVLLAALRGRK